MRAVAIARERVYSIINLSIIQYKTSLYSTFLIPACGIIKV